jgi:diguanylate cyclase (GGDEF)-like protein
MFLNVKPMIIVNIVSAMLYLSLALRSKIKKTKTMLLITYSEVIMHSILATVIVGWDCGFALYIICLIPATIYLRGSITRYIFLGGILSTSMFIGLRIYSYFNTSFYKVSGISQLSIYVFNCISSLMIIVIVCILFIKEISDSERLLIETNKQLNYLASIDPLKKLQNRRAMKEKMKMALKKRDENKEPFAIAICDIDDFKKFNDKYGHDCGDFVLKKVSSIITSSLKNTDSVCRWGGEEILILIQNSERDIAKEVIKKICTSIANTKMSYYNININVTVTIGASFSKKKTTIGEMTLKADKRLYKGKRLGKNRVEY